MATKKTDDVQEHIQELAIAIASDTERQEHEFAIAALQSVDWNQIGMGVDQAAKLCWSMAQAMVRNKP
jgi:phage gp36-like protein